jgi:predicted  nucleic acid-binding Zn-ribbon protein
MNICISLLTGLKQEGQMSRKEAYIVKAQAKIDELVAKLDQLKAKAQGEIADQKLKSHEKIAELESKIKDAKAHLSEITDTAGDAWENLKDKFDHLADDIGGSFKRFFGKDKQDNHPKDAGPEDEKL